MIKIISLLLVLLPASVSADSYFHIDNIKIEGATRISKEALLSYLPLKNGRLDMSDSAYVIKQLFKENVYKDIQLFADGDNLLIKVVERPSIDSISFDGNKKLEDKQLESILNDANIKKGRTFNRSILSRIETELRKFYVSFGKYSVQIDTELVKLKRNRVALKVKIFEGNVSKIQQINIIGNTVFSDDKLLSLMELGIVSEINPFSSADEYSKAKLSGDIEILKTYYLDRGYLRFAIKSTQVKLSPDKENVFISIHLSEGEQYSVSEVDIKGDFKLEKSILFDKLTIKSNSVFSRKKMINSSKNIKDRLGDDGYAFATVSPIPEINEENKSVKLTYLVNAKDRVYVRRINIQGNTKTHDEVFRREFRQLESALLSPRLLDRSKIRIQRLSYVASVNNEITRVPNLTDQVDITTSIVERESGSFSIGGGFSNNEGLLFNLSFAQSNILGTGKNIGINFDNSSVNKKLSLTLINPYYTLDGISRSLSVYFSEVDASRISTTADYLTNNTGGSISYGIPRSETETLNLAIGIDQTRISTTTKTPTSISDFLAVKGKDFDEIKLSASYVNDTRNRTVFASTGSKHSLSLEMSVPGSTLEYYKSTYRLEYNKALTDLTTLVFRSNISYGHSYSSDESLAFFKRYYAGGVHSIRGYRFAGVGVKDTDGRALGGDLLTTGSLEIVIPPFDSDLSSSVRYSLFSDFGTVFSKASDANISDIRYSVGAAFKWLSPVGPLNFSITNAVNADSTDFTESFQFFIGGQF